MQNIERKYEPLGSLEKVADGLSEEDTDYSSKCDVDDDFKSDIATLRDYSFIATGEDRMVFTMHRLVQLTVRMWLKTYGKDEKWKERFINNLYFVLPTGEYTN